MLWPPFLSAFDWGRYRLGPFGHLQRTVDRFAGFFARESAAVRKGMHSWEELDPAQADAGKCLPGETPLTCELRATNASFALIRLGANDSLTPGQFEPAMRQIIQTCINLGVVPILGTKPDHYEGPENTINQLIRRLAAEHRVPLWDFDLLAETVPGRGLQPDGLHLKEGGADDYADPASFRFIGPMEDLSALMALDAAGRAVGGE
ncbi:MAG: SGNH/GDSL hydrolase family protein, partial [Anaerolineae bacterium]